MPDTRVESEPPRSEPICLYEMIDSVELAKRLTVPESWVRDRTRSFASDPIPHLKLGRYVRFRWGSREMESWLANHLVSPSPNDLLRTRPLQNALPKRPMPFSRRTGRQSSGHLFKKGESWFLRYRETVIGDDGPKRVQRCRRIASAIGTTRTKGAARAVANEFLGLNRKEAPDFSVAMTLGTFMEHIYFPAVKVENEHSTYQSYMNVWNRYLQSISELRLVEIRTATAEKALQNVAAQFDLSRSSYQNIKHLLSAALAHARRNGYLNSDADPIRDAKTPHGKMPAFTYAYSLNEARSILGILPEPVKTMVAVAAFTGVRKSELVALKWENYDGNRVFVTEKFTHGKVGTPKCNSQGVIPVAETLRQYLETHRAATGSPEEGYIFRSAAGTPISIDRLTISVVRPTLKAANIPWYGWHAFRRGFATSLFHLHVADRIIQQLLRHSDIATTMNVYVKAVGEDGRDAIAMLDKTFQRNVA